MILDQNIEILNIIKNNWGFILSGLTATATPKFRKTFWKNLDMCDAKQLLRHHLTGLICIMRYEQNQKNRIGYHSFYKTTHRQIWNYLLLAAKKESNCPSVAG
jgi:hypothetical protein